MGLIHLDAGGVAGFLDGNDAHHEAARTMFADTLRNGDRLSMASLDVDRHRRGPTLCNPLPTAPS